MDIPVVGRLSILEFSILGEHAGVGGMGSGQRSLPIVVRIVEGHVGLPTFRTLRILLCTSEIILVT